ncbi:hypothetical protein [Variovorax sp. LG9.2]|uniref:hypothetical protein n=1 Tax=Variovorax sp. LG9.2 TaxID=3048626 RepID=UPI002B235FA5|nr:hypothetical protein [Variovorax sp. LG9.2]MEB0057292.1 hypothetical protein [Variovorax sp. LG9.2]
MIDKPTPKKQYIFSSFDHTNKLFGLLVNQEAKLDWLYARVDSAHEQGFDYNLESIGYMSNKHAQRCREIAFATALKTGYKPFPKGTSK